MPACIYQKIGLLLLQQKLITMALNAYLKLKGQKQGIIKGSVTQKGREGKIMVIAVSHEITSPRDAASGLPTGKRMHKPFVITKELDKSSPPLYTALCTNENITEFELQFWTPQTGALGGAGTEKQHYTVKLTNASIVDIRFSMLNNKNPELMRYAEYEEVAFAYQKIEWTWVDGGITSSDNR
jgi:type VI secretion system secreted protein Hcp